MKKTVSIILALVALFSLFSMAGCQSDTARYAEDENITEYIKLPDYKNLVVDTTTLAFKMALEYNNYTNIGQLDVEIEQEGLDDGFVAILDTAIIDYVGKKDGIPFEGGTAKGADLLIGSGSFIEGFEEGLVGVKVGETVDLKLTFPEGYQEASLAGKDVVFTVTVKGILRPKMPKVTDEMAGWLGYKSAKEYNEGIKKDYIISKAWEMFMAGVEVVKMPQFELDRYVNDSLESLKEKAEQEGSEYEDYLINSGYATEEDYVAAIKPYGEAYIKMKLAAHLYAKQEKIEVSEKEINEFAAEQYAEDEEIEDSELRKIKDTLLINKVNNDLIKKIKIK